MSGQVVEVEESRIRPRYRIDEVEASWRRIGL